MDALDVMWVTSSGGWCLVDWLAWQVVARWWSGVSASLRMLCGSAALSVSDRGRGTTL